MDTRRHCSNCGRVLSRDSAEGLCAACLLAVGLEPLSKSDTGMRRSDPRPPAESQLLTPGQTFGNYRVGRLLGRGGMGEVYEADHLETGRRLALKVLRNRFRAAADRARFLREGQLAASISHPRAVYVFGSEEIDGTPVIEMELVSGGTLKHRVEQDGPLPVGTAVAATLDIIDGLDAAQAAGILHRDIKPSNCFVEADGTVKIGDFGLSISTLARGRDDSVLAGFQGTPEFAAPEQLRGEPLDVRADIYAVGATLYYLLTGRAPFDAPTLRELVSQVTEGHGPPSPRRIRRNIPSGLASVVLQCLASNPTDRPPSYAALAGALLPFAPREDVSAPLGVRTAAGAFDSAILALATVVPAMWFIDPFTASNRDATIVAVIGWLMQVGYYLVLEGKWGASVGKRLFRLRVTLPDGSPASWTRIAIRAFVFCLPPVVTQLVPAGGDGVAPQVLGSIASLAVSMSVFLTARRHNRWAGVHDLASGTRVVSREALAVRTERTDSSAFNLHAVDSMTGDTQFGPYTVVFELEKLGAGRLMLGFDPMLQRPVWLHQVPVGTPEIAPARRDVSRAGRLRWLTGRRSPDENWDAFEAPTGGPLIARSSVAVEWPRLKSWLIDLVNELTASLRHGTLPPLGLEYLWVRDDGRLVLLDFRAPGVLPTDAGELTPVGLVAAVVARCLPTWRREARTLRLSVRQLLERLSGSEPPSFEEVRSYFHQLMARPDHVERWRRAAPIVAAAAPTLCLLLLFLLTLPAFAQFQRSEHMEMMHWINLLQRPDAAGGRLRDPQIRDAVEKYVVGRYGELIRDERTWRLPMMQQPPFAGARTTATEIARRHTPVTQEELARVSELLAPHMPALGQPEAELLTMMPFVVPALAAFPLLMSLFATLVSSAAVPGGILLRGLGLAVVTDEGVEIGRLRSLARALVAWMPVMIWLVVEGAAFVGRPGAMFMQWQFPVVVLGTMAVGAAWTIVHPSRGLHDALVDTWVIPR